MSVTPSEQFVWVTYGTDLKIPDFAEIAEAAGCFGTRVNSPESILPTLEQIFAHPGPALIDVVVNRQ